MLTRMCTVCGLNKSNYQVPATHVATGPSNIQWYECESHGPDDHPHFSPRQSIERIEIYDLKHNVFP